MRCKWCGEETPDNSTFCEKCGHPLESAEIVSDTEAAYAEDADAKTPSIEMQVGEEAAYEVLSPEALEDLFQESFIEVDVDAIRRTYADDPLVEPPSPPIQPKLSKGRVAVVGTIAVLFSAAVILLAWAAIMRVLGL